MTGATVRPVAAGYVALPGHAHPGDAEDLVRELRLMLAAYAQTEGYALGPVIADVRGRGESGLYDLVSLLHRGEAVAVVVPDLGHLTHGPCLAGADRLTAARFLRAPVLPVEPCAESGGAATGSGAGSARPRDGERRDG